MIAGHYNVITGIGEYYFVTESDSFTYPAEKINISAKERWEIEKQFDERIVPDGAWRSCLKKTDTVLLNLECRDRYPHKFPDNIPEIAIHADGNSSRIQSQPCFTVSRT